MGVIENIRNQEGGWELSHIIWRGRVYLRGREGGLVVYSWGEF